MYYLILLLTLISCSSVGPNYNQGKTHNDNLNNRSRIVNKEDERMRKVMERTRNKASKGLNQNKCKINKKNRKIIR